MKSNSANPENTPDLRPKAEKILKKRKGESSDLPTEDLLRLVHELEVHQIELELQNEELIQARAGMEAALNQYSNLYDFSPAGYITLTQAGKIHEANLAATRFIGIERTLLLQKRLINFVMPESLPVFNDFFKQLISGQGEISCELALGSQEGNPFWVQLEATCFEGGEYSRVTLMDINERKEAERNIRQRVKELQLLYDNGLALSQLLNPQQIAEKITELLENRMDWHHIVVRIFDAEKNGFKVLSVRHASLAGDQAGADLIELLNKSISKPKDGLSGRAFLTSRVLRSGQLEQEQGYIASFPGMHSGLYVPIRIDNNSIGVISVESHEPNAFSEDDERLVSTLANQAAVAFENASLFEAAQKELEERKRIELLLAEEKEQLTYRVAERTANLNKSNFDLALALRAKDEFLASMSHELRTPLASILGLSESLQLNTYGELSPRQTKAIVTIEESGSHLLELINDILDLSKLNAGMFEVSLTPSVVEQICQSSLHLTKGMSEKRKQHVTFTCPDTTITIHADARRMKQAFVNLLSNAIKFTPVGGDLGLDVQLDEIKQQVKITVWDKGIGIQPDQMPKLFKPFTQIDASLSREYAGTGLGLSLVKDIVELHNGEIQLNSIFGEGSQFSITLPVLASKTIHTQELNS